MEADGCSCCERRAPVTMWVGPRQSKNAPYRKGENMDGMEVQENEAGRGGGGGGGGGRVKGQRGGKERGGGMARTGCIDASVCMCVGRDGDGEAHTTTTLVTWSLTISRWLCECGGWCRRYR